MLGGFTARRFRTASVALLMAVLMVGLPVVVNVWFVPGRAGSRGPAVPHDAYVVTSPVRIANAPEVVLKGGWLYDSDGISYDTSTKLVFDAASISVSASPGAPSTSVAEEVFPILLSQLSSMTFDTLQIRRGQIDVTSDGMERETLKDVDVLITCNRKGGYTAKGTVTYRGNSVAFDAQWAIPADRKASLRIPLKIDLKSEILQASIDGRLATAEGLRLQGNADVLVRKLRGLARTFGIALPSSNEFKDTRLKGTLDWAAGTLTFSRAAINLDGNEGSGALAISTAKPVPSIDGTLAFDTLDLTRYAGLVPSIAALWWPVGFGFDDADVAPSFVGRLDADLRMSASKIVVPYVQSGRGAVTVTLKDGKLLADVAELELESGTFGGQVTADMTGEIPRYELRGKLENIDAGRGLSGVMHRNPLQGRANIVLELQGRGFDAKDLLETVSGKADFALSDAGRLGLDLRALLYAAQRSEIKGWTAAGKGQTALEQLEAQLNIHNGVINTDALNAKSGGLTITGSGSVNVARQLLDMKLKFSNAAGGERANLADEALRLRGGWTEPEIRVERQHRAQAPN